MSCNCCTNTLNYCDQNVCGEIDFDILAQVPGIHTLTTFFLNKKITIEKEFSVDELIIFPLDTLNENYEYKVELFDPNGDKIIIRKSDIDYDCFKFYTSINVTVAVEIES